MGWVRNQLGTHETLTLEAIIYPFLVVCRFVSLTELSFIDMKDIASFIKLSGWFSRVGWSCF